jgi:D-alanyl-D-alanine carboxypeptidase
MNAEALRLGMTRSHFTNPNGLPDPQTYTTARDMAVLARAILNDFPQYRFYFDLPAIQIGGRVLRNFNTLIDRYPGATGMKTGFICASGYNLVGSARRGNRELIAVVFGAQGGRARAEQAAELLDEAFTKPKPARDDDYPTLQTIFSGASYMSPFDMRAYVCGPRPVTVASEENDDGAEGDPAESHLTETRIDRGPPIKVTARIPAIFGEDGFVAPLPRPRPTAVAATPPAELNAFAPVEGDETSGPAEAIGAAAGGAQGLNTVAPPAE